MVLCHDPYDETILELARKLCRELSVTRHKSQKLIWSRTVASDECSFTPPAFRSRGVRLQLALRGKLTPEEFAPIIASSLVFSYKTRWGEGTRLFLPSLLPAVNRIIRYINVRQSLGLEDGVPDCFFGLCSDRSDCRDEFQ